MLKYYREKRLTKAQQLLNLYQCDYNRRLEENFAQTLAERENVRVFFINENQPSTDGSNIILDPSMDNLYCDQQALTQIEAYLNLPKGSLRRNPWDVLRLTTRSQNIHECLHLLYTDFPNRALSDPLGSTRNRLAVLSLIANIIEDAYIEKAGAIAYDNMGFFLRFGRVAQVCVHKEAKGSVEKRIRDLAKDGDNAAQSKLALLMAYLDYLVVDLLYPMVKITVLPSPLVTYIDRTRELVAAGSCAPSCRERYEYVRQIFSVIEELIPEDTEQLDLTVTQSLLSGTKTHGAASTLQTKHSKGRRLVVGPSLWQSGEGDAKALAALKEQFERERAAQEAAQHKEGEQTVIHIGESYGGAVAHRGIKVKEYYPPVEYKFRKAYENIYREYKVSISSYINRFTQLLASRDRVRQEKLYFGSGITSSRLSDVKGRYWHRDVIEETAPDIALLLLIDGSGSMDGERAEAAMLSSVIIHEVLSAVGIKHAIVEHRAHYIEPEVEANVLVKFAAPAAYKYNLLKIEAGGDNRDGLMLLWAADYLVKQVRAERKFIIVIADGLPCHEYDEYYPPRSVVDTAMIAKRLKQQGVGIVAIALDAEDSYECYEDLKKIYTNVVHCDDLTHLAGQIFKVIGKML